MAWGRAKPSYTGTPWETPSPESMTIPVVRPEAYRESTAWMATYMAGMLKVSNMIWVIFSLLALGLRGASVRRTGCSLIIIIRVKIFKSSAFFNLLIILFLRLALRFSVASLFLFYLFFEWSLLPIFLIILG